MKTTLYTAPVKEPVHLNEAKIWLRLAVTNAAAEAYTNEDDLLSGQVKAARRVAEGETWRALILQVWDLYLDDWPEGDDLKLPFPPLRAVEFVKYTTSAGTLTTWDSSNYSVDTDGTPGRIVLGYEKSWPDAELTPKNPIQIRFRCGYAAPFSAVAATDLITCVNHSFIDGSRTRLSVSGGSLPGGLSADTDYYVRDVSGDTFKLAATSGGSAIDLTTAGTGNLFCGEVPRDIVSGMLLVLTDLYNERADSVGGQLAVTTPIPRGASILFAMDSARELV